MVRVGGYRIVCRVGLLEENRITRLRHPMMKDVKNISVDVQNTCSDRAFQITGCGPIGAKILSRLRTICSREKVGQDCADDFLAMHGYGSEPL